MNYTIEEINEAWIAFNKPKLLINRSKNLNPKDLEETIAPNENIKFIYRTDFISFLIDWRKRKLVNDH